jgi:hypothetical protein
LAGDTGAIRREAVEPSGKLHFGERANRRTRNDRAARESGRIRPRIAATRNIDLRVCFDVVEATQAFLFLEQDLGFTCAGSSTVEEDPRDSYVVVKYRREDFRVDVAWNPSAMSLGILVRLDNQDLRRREKSVYFEPFLEFASHGAITPVVPQIYPGMSDAMIVEAMKGRKQVFESGLGELLGKIAERLRTHLTSLQNASVETVRNYHHWYRSRGGVA